MFLIFNAILTFWDLILPLRIKLFPYFLAINDPKLPVSSLFPSSFILHTFNKLLLHRWHFISLCVMIYLSAGVSTYPYYIFGDHLPQPSHKESAMNKQDNLAEPPFLTNLPKAVAYSDFPDFSLSASQRWTPLKSSLLPPTWILKWVQSGKKYFKISKTTCLKFTAQCPTLVKRATMWGVLMTSRSVKGRNHKQEN